MFRGQNGRGAGVLPPSPKPPPRRGAATFHRRFTDIPLTFRHKKFVRGASLAAPAVNEIAIARAEKRLGVAPPRLASRHGVACDSPSDGHNSSISARILRFRRPTP